MDENALSVEERLFHACASLVRWPKTETIPGYTGPAPDKLLAAIRNGWLTRRERRALGEYVARALCFGQNMDPSAEDFGKCALLPTPAEASSAEDLPLAAEPAWAVAVVGYAPRPCPGRRVEPDIAFLHRTVAAVACLPEARLPPLLAPERMLVPVEEPANGRTLGPHLLHDYARLVWLRGENDDPAAAADWSREAKQEAARGRFCESVQIGPVHAVAPAGDYVLWTETTAARNPRGRYPLFADGEHGEKTAWEQAHQITTTAGAAADLILVIHNTPTATRFLSFSFLIGIRAASPRDAVALASMIYRQYATATAWITSNVTRAALKPLMVEQRASESIYRSLRFEKKRDSGVVGVSSRDGEERRSTLAQRGLYLTHALREVQRSFGDSARKDLFPFSWITLKQASLSGDNLSVSAWHPDGPPQDNFGHVDRQQDREEGLFPVVAEPRELPAQGKSAILEASEPRVQRHRARVEALIDYAVTRKDEFSAFAGRLHTGVPAAVGAPEERDFLLLRLPNRRLTAAESDAIFDRYVSVSVSPASQNLEWFVVPVAVDHAREIVHSDPTHGEEVMRLESAVLSALAAFEADDTDDESRTKRGTLHNALTEYLRHVKKVFIGDDPQAATGGLYGRWKSAEEVMLCMRDYVDIEYGIADPENLEFFGTKLQEALRQYLNVTDESVSLESLWACWDQEQSHADYLAGIFGSAACYHARQKYRRLGNSGSNRFPSDPIDAWTLVNYALWCDFLCVREEGAVEGAAPPSPRAMTPPSELGDGERWRAILSMMRPISEDNATGTSDHNVIRDAIGINVGFPQWPTLQWLHAWDSLNNALLTDYAQEQASALAANRKQSEIHRRILHNLGHAARAPYNVSIDLLRNVYSEILNDSEIPEPVQNRHADSLDRICRVVRFCGGIPNMAAMGSYLQRRPRQAAVPAEDRYACFWTTNPVFTLADDDFTLTKDLIAEALECILYYIAKDRRRDTDAQICNEIIERVTFNGVLDYSKLIIWPQWFEKIALIERDTRTPLVGSSPIATGVQAMIWEILINAIRYTNTSHQRGGESSDIRVLVHFSRTNRFNTPYNLQDNCLSILVANHGNSSGSPGIHSFAVTANDSEGRRSSGLGLIDMCLNDMGWAEYVEPVDIIPSRRINESESDFNYRIANLNIYDDMFEASGFKTSEGYQISGFLCPFEAHE